MYFVSFYRDSFNSTVIPTILQSTHGFSRALAHSLSSHISAHCSRALGGDDPIGLHSGQSLYRDIRTKGVTES